MMDTIDFNHADQEILANRLWTCLSKYGFAQIVNHGLNCTTISDAYSSANEFFNQQENMKCRAIHADKARKGYSPLHSENFAALVGEPDKPNDSVEKFRMGPPHYNNYDRSLPFRGEESNQKANLFQKNEWNFTPPGFENSLTSYYVEIEQFAATILNMFETASSLPKGYFSSKMTRHSSILTLNHYPKLENINASVKLHSNLKTDTSPSTNSLRVRVAEHTDVSIITLVSQSGPGLQIIDSSGEWQPIPFIPGAIIVNIGDCLADWSGGLLKSTRHRVCCPIPISNDESVPDIQGNGEEEVRYSIAYFASPDLEALMDWPSEVHCPGNSGATNSLPTRPIMTYSNWRKDRIFKAMRTMRSLKTKKAV